MPHLTANGIAMHYRDSGAGPRAILFVHALGANLRIWDDVAARLDGAPRCIRYDLRGHGQSTVTDGPYSLDLFAADLVALMEGLGIAKATVCGVSIGGLIAQRAALLVPDRIEALVLCDTGARIGTRESWQDRIRLVGGRGLPDMAREITARWFGADFRQRAKPMCDLLQADLAAMSPVGYIGACHALRDGDLSSEIAGLRAPVLVACGAEDVAAPPAVARDLASRIPGARLEIIPGAGHLPCVEAPDALARSINHFLLEAKVA